MTLGRLFIGSTVNSQRLCLLEVSVNKKSVVWLSVARNGAGAIHPERCCWRPW